MAAAVKPSYYLQNLGLKMLLRMFAIASPAILAALTGCARPVGLPLRLVTWNVHGCQAGVDKVVGQLRQFNADVICLQEVESWRPDAPQDHHGERIAQQLDMSFISSLPPTADDREEQMAILFHGELTESEALSRHTGRCHALTARICWGNRRIRIVCVHLTSNATTGIGPFFATGITRLKEVGRLCEYLDRSKDEMIVTGDFNAVPGMPELTVIASRLRWTPYFQLTHPSERPILQLDHVFCRGSVHVSSIGARRSLGSDHWPVLAEIQLTERPAR